MSKRRGSNDDDGTFQEAELKSLQREYRLIEGSRKAMSDEAQHTLCKQEAHIAKLQQDQKFLQDELQALNPKQSSGKGKRNTVTQQQRQLTTYETQIEEYLGVNAELDKQLKEMEKEIASCRKKLGGASGIEEKKAKQNAHIKTQENRLEQTLKKYNQCLTGNGKLRQKVDHLKQERKVFDTMHSRLEKEQNKLKRRMATVVEESQQAHHSREEAQHRMEALDEKAARELQQYNLEIKDLSRVLDHDKKLKTFMGIKAMPRGLEDVGANQKRKAKGSDTSEQLVQTYEEAFRKIKASTGIEDTTKLVDRFIEVEDKNFALFNLVNELNNEIENNQEAINETKGNIKKFNLEGEALDKQRKVTLHNLEDRLVVAESESKLFQEKHIKATEDLAVLISGIQRIFESPVCDKSLIGEMLGTSSVNETNVMQYLGAIEQRTNELLQLQAILDHKDKTVWEKKEAEMRDELEDDTGFDPSSTLGPKPTPVGLLGTGPREQVTTSSIVPPSTNDDFDNDEESDDEVLAPLSHAEMRTKVLSMSRK
eukprot:m.37980 g.37980  ORF g.37980 m.37980 type:complete len:539 (+) comp10171_c0_seq1:1275-2891(+)